MKEAKPCSACKKELTMNGYCSKCRNDHLKKTRANRSPWKNKAISRTTVVKKLQYYIEQLEQDNVWLCVKRLQDEIERLTDGEIKPEEIELPRRNTVDKNLDIVYTLPKRG